jgi:hypothetical protein
VRRVFGVQRRRNPLHHCLVINVIGQQFAAEHDGQRLCTVNRTNHQRVNILEQRLVGVLGVVSLLALLVTPQPDHPVELVQTDVHTVIVPVKWRQGVVQRGVYRREVGGRPHQDLIRTQRNHRRGRGALQRHQRHKVAAVLAQQVDEAQRHLSTAAVRLEEQVDRVLPAKPCQHVIQRHHVRLANRPAGVVPVAHYGAAQTGLKLRDHSLRFRKQHGRLFDLGFLFLRFHDVISKKMGAANGHPQHC